MKTKVSILFYAKRAKASVNGLVPIYTRITINGKRIELSTTPNTIGGTIQFDIRELVNGIYFVNILNNDGSVTSTKFIKR